MAADGEMLDVGIAPVDGPMEADGTWELEEGSLVLRSEGATPLRIYELVSVDEERLVVKRLE